MADRDEVPPDVVAALRAVCTPLPEVREEQAWVGTRWQVRGRTFAHVLRVDGGHPPAYARAVGSDGPVDVLMFRSAGPELGALRQAGPPFFAPVWRRDEVGMVLGEATDWDEVRELLTDSWCLRAPEALAATVERPDGTPG